MAFASRCTLHASGFLMAASFVLPHGLAVAEMSGGGPVNQGSRPLSEISTNVGAGSGPVRDEGGSIRDGRGGPLSGNSVRGSVTGDVVSGPVSEVSLGAVTADRPVAGGGTVTDSSAGAVKKDIDSPLGEMISQPLHDLRPLQEQLRAVQPLPSEAAAAEEAAAAASEAEALSAQPPSATPEAAEAADDGEAQAAEPPPADTDQPEGGGPEVKEAPPPQSEAAPEAAEDAQAHQEGEQVGGGEEQPPEEAPPEPEPTPQP